MSRGHRRKQQKSDPGLTFHPESMLCRKVRYPTEIEAKIRLALVAGRDGDKVEQRCYPCNKCRGWHLTGSARRPTIE